MPTGFPDLVLAVYKPNSMKRARRGQLSVPELKLLHHLYNVKTTTEVELIHGLIWKKKALERALDKLQNSNLIRIEGKTIHIRPARKNFILCKIITIEAKISHWRKALEQALANTWFASHSYILIPETSAVGRIAAAAVTLGVGVLVFNGKSTKEIVKPTANKIPSSYGSWLINEWVMRRLIIASR